MPTSSVRTGTIPALTGLRFFAALMVFFSHYPIAGINEDIGRFFASGYSGVTFFFVLSGFIIAYNYLDRFETNPASNTPRYLWARFCRVYPIYFLTMAFVYLQQGGQGPVSVYVLALQSWHPNIYVIGGLNGPAWSISVEAFLYLTFPLLLPLFNKLGVFQNKGRLVTLVLLIIFAQFAAAVYLSMPPRDLLSPADPNSSHRWLYNFPLLRIMDFSLGILAAIYFSRHVKSGASEKPWRLISYASIAVVLAVMASKNLYYSAYSWDAAYAGAFTLLILSLAMDQQSRLSKALSTKKIVFLGEASFAFYMIHMIAAPIFAAKAPGSFVTNVIFEMFFLGLIMTMSVGLHVAVEKPCRDFLNGLISSKKAVKPKAIKIEP
jgi:peptidoglycan/LPS O-acetylase OafA/YrhL